MPELPSGIITLLFIDIEGSTRLWEQHPEAMRAALARHDALLTAGIQQHGGLLVKGRGEGDSLFAVFAEPGAAVAAACALQQALLAEPWPAEAPLRVRMALHTDTADRREGDYYGPGVNRCARLRAVAHGGQVLLSQATAGRVRDQLPAGVSLRDLGSHRLKDLQQPEQLFQLLHPDLPAEFPPLRSLEAFAHNLPVQLTRFIGRDQEMIAVKRLLAGTHLLTLTGSGGCGKTRLAQQIAADLLEQYPDGVWLVELAPLADPALVPQTVAATLGVREQPGQALPQTLVDYLRPRQMLLLLDNCEHLLTACAQLAEALLRACPMLQVLASSREGLGIAGEQMYRVPSLAVPDPRQLPALEHLQQLEAVQLFTDRACLSQPAFVLTAANATAVATICHRLDGIPLAIELAAARVKALPVEKISARLSDMFRLVAGGSRTALPRQQTLRALIDWSYDLLCEAEQVLLRRLSVFVGGWTLEAVEAVGAGDGIESWEVIDLLTALVGKSLVLLEERDGEARYHLLETLRQYARDRLLELGEAELVRTRHRDWFLALAEEADQRLRGPDPGAWLKQLDHENENLRAALAWSREQGEAEAGLRMLGALGLFWSQRGYGREGLERLEEVLALPGAAAALQPGDSPDVALTRARALSSGARWSAIQQSLTYSRESVTLLRGVSSHRDLAEALWLLGKNAPDQEEGQRLLQESLALARKLDDPWLAANALGMLGWFAWRCGDHQASGSLLDETLTLRRKLGRTAELAEALSNQAYWAFSYGDLLATRAYCEECVTLFQELGMTSASVSPLLLLRELAHAQGDDASARALFEASVTIARQTHNLDGLMHELVGLGQLARGRGEYNAARSLLEESRTVAHEAGREHDAKVLGNLGLAAIGQGDLVTARSALAEALKQSLESRDDWVFWGIVECLEGFAFMAAAQGQAERAARLFGAAERVREEHHIPRRPFEQPDYNRHCTAARTALDEITFAAAWAEGRELSLDQAVECALPSE